MKSILVFILLITVLSCNMPERNCSDFKTGSFEFKYKVNGEDKTSRFTRSEDLQVEIYDNNIDSSKVRWINDCEAIFKTINPKNMAERKDVHLKILTTTDSSYTFEYSYVGETHKQKGIAVRVK